MSAITVLCLFAFSASLMAQEEMHPKNLPTGDAVVYKTIEGRQLHMYVHNPADLKDGKSKAVVLFFHGGGWIGGGPQSFNQQAEAVAAHGAVGITVEYRLLAKARTEPPKVCVEDTKSAVRYVRAHAIELHVDPDRIAGSGGSAGGYDIAYSAAGPDWDDPADDLKISAKPNLLVLYNPAIDVPGKLMNDTFFHGEAKMRSPILNADKTWPPTFVMSGSADQVIPEKVLGDFQAKMQRLGVPFELKIYPGRTHAFFNKEPDKLATTEAMIAYLAKQGYVKP